MCFCGRLWIKVVDCGKLWDFWVGFKLWSIKKATPYWEWLN